MKIKFGTNRIVLAAGRYVYKFALSPRGIAANYMEFINALSNPLVAVTELRRYGLRQERLTDIVVYPYGAEKADISPEHRALYGIMLHNRLQVGRDIYGSWKIFDYEDIKFYLKK